MSFRNFKSLQTIDSNHAYSEQVKSEINIVNSYLNIHEWNAKKSFQEILEEKLKNAKLIKQNLIKIYGINDYKDVVGFRCQVCSGIFDQPTALGGHMSKAHPNYRK